MPQYTFKLFLKGEIIMRKLMNKKGFSLVELMIVVVIMGILIAVAIPLYGAITDNANNKTCASNIKTIKTNAANYFASHDQKAISEGDDLKAMFDDGKLPKCPVGDTDYVVAINQKTGAAKVFCPSTAGTATTGKEFHTTAKTGSEAATLTTAGDLKVVS